MIEKYGVIEGFYGIPWTFDERVSMINFPKDVGMNQYVYAPKDDPYHNIRWREPYPKQKLEELSELSRLSEENGIDFVWAIHPGQNLIDFSKYEEEVQRLFAKYDSLRVAGVKSFALCMDDVDKKKAYEQRDFHLRLVKDILKYLESFSNKNLLFVHPWYNDSWLDEDGRKYFELFRGIDNLSVMWTGRDVLSPISEESNRGFYEIYGKEADIWFNWPVNDYKNDRIFMEVFEFYTSRRINYKSLLSNPMNQAELSKLSIYQIAEFVKNPQVYKPLDAFKKALAYLDEDVWESLYIISDSFFQSGIYDKVDEKEFLEDYEINLAYQKKAYKDLVRLINRKLDALDKYFANYTNVSLNKEVEPFFRSLQYLLRAVRSLILKDRQQAVDYYKKSNQEKVPIYKESSPTKLEEIPVKTSRVLEKIYKDLLEEEDICTDQLN